MLVGRMPPAGPTLNCLAEQDSQSLTVPLPGAAAGECRVPGSPPKDVLKSRRNWLNRVPRQQTASQSTLSEEHAPGRYGGIKMHEHDEDFNPRSVLPIPPTKSFGSEDYRDPYLDSDLQEPGLAPDQDSFLEDSENELLDGQRTAALQQGVRSNMAVTGLLTLHFQDRDLEVHLDGYAALRVLANIELGNELWSDIVNPFLSDARAGWMSIRTDRLLGASWLPRNKDTGGFSVEPLVA